MMTGRTLGGVLAWTIGGAAGTMLFLYASPALEAHFAPVLTDQRVVVDKDDRSPGRMCWTWEWQKQRYAEPIVVAWSLSIEGTAVEFPAITQRQRDGEVLRNPQASALGPGRNDLCVIIPAELDKLPGVTIRGQINYRLPHRLWTIWQELPVVRVPPL